MNPLRQAGRVKTRFLSFLSPISIIHIDPCAFDVRTGLFVHFHTSKEFISVDLCYNDLRREEKKSRQHNRANWYNIHLLLRVSMLHNVTVEGSRGMMGAKRDRERELHSNEGMPGAVGWGWGRWDSRMTLLVGDLYPLVEWPSSHGKIYRISEVLS